MKREDFMARVGKATAGLTKEGHPGVFAQPHPRADAGEDELVELFRARLAELAGDQELVVCADERALLLAVRHVLEGVDPDDVLWAGEPCDPPREIEVGICTGVAAAAASASVILDVGTPEAGLASLLCLHSVIVVPRDVLVPEVLTWYASAGVGERSRYVVQVTGASRTADIQKTLVSPAHGPARLTVILGPAGCAAPSRERVLAGG